MMDNFIYVNKKADSVALMDEKTFCDTCNITARVGTHSELCRKMLSTIEFVGNRWNVDAKIMDEKGVYHIMRNVTSVRLDFIGESELYNLIDCLEYSAKVLRQKSGIRKPSIFERLYYKFVSKVINKYFK